MSISSRKLFGGFFSLIDNIIALVTQGLLDFREGLTTNTSGRQEMLENLINEFI